MAMERIGGSFRDASGFVYRQANKVLRTINSSYAPHWEHATDSGLLEGLIATNKLIPFREVSPLCESYKTLEVEKIPFISYPYEWCFSQLRDAAILTLDLHLQALGTGMILKDASSYNIQFRGTNPTFIDLLSFSLYEEGKPWSAYRQFCMHFLAPLALISYTDLHCGVLSKLWVEGIPLGLASKLLPTKLYLNGGITAHLHLHAKFEEKHGDARASAAKARKINITPAALKNIAESLVRTVKKIKKPTVKTEWGEYYNGTNYSDVASQYKKEVVTRIASESSGIDLAIDFGANTGVFSRLIAPYCKYVVALDIDHMAVERHYRYLKENGPSNILPLVIDLVNPSPSLGWACRERDAIFSRDKAQLAVSLALIHHLVITGGIPIPLIAEHFADYLDKGGMLILEFVPKEDSQVKRLLAVREDIFDEYTITGMQTAFGVFFEELASFSVPTSTRTLHLFRRK